MARATGNQDRRDIAAVVDLGRHTDAVGVAKLAAVLVTFEHTSPHMCGRAAAAVRPRRRGLVCALVFAGAGVADRLAVLVGVGRNEVAYAGVAHGAHRAPGHVTTPSGSFRP